MNLQQAITVRRATRQYFDQPIPRELQKQIQDMIEHYNATADVCFRVVFDEPKVFRSLLLNYGLLNGVSNYIVVEAKKQHEERCGYIGELITLQLTTMGLQTCWVGFQGYTKRVQPVESTNKIFTLIAFGFGQVPKQMRKSKTIQQVMRNDGPKWYMDGVQAALLAPTSMNQQKFQFAYDHGVVHCQKGIGAHSTIDLGIVKAHFDIGSQTYYFLEQQEHLDKSIIWK